MAAGVSLGFMRYEGLWVMRVMGYEGYELNARTRFLYYFAIFLQSMYGPIVLIRNVSIFSFSLFFFLNLLLLEKVWDPLDRIMS